MTLVQPTSIARPARPSAQSPVASSVRWGQVWWAEGFFVSDLGPGACLEYRGHAGILAVTLFYCVGRDGRQDTACRARFRDEVSCTGGAGGRLRGDAGGSPVFGGDWRGSRFRAARVLAHAGGRGGVHRLWSVDAARRYPGR